MILIIDFGSQTTHLIGRRLRGMGVEMKIVSPGKKFSSKPSGIILSGGPASIYDKGAPKINKDIFNLGVPVLGICYGLHTIGHLLGGIVRPGKKEFGPAKIKIIGESELFAGIPKTSDVWMSHGDELKKLPKGFRGIAKTSDVKFAAVSDEKRKIYAVQFHPEVTHTKYGTEILKNFLKICKVKVFEKTIDINKLIEDVKNKIGGGKAIGAVSGGVDSTVASVLVARAIGKNYFPIYIESGLMRVGTREDVIKIFKENLNISPIVVDAEEIFLNALKGVVDPEEKRKIIGKLYIDLFQKEAEKIKGVKFLVQGTIYSDVIESKGSKHADKIKSHHNVGGLPENLNFDLVEPLREFYKDEVREIGRKLGLADEIVNKHPFPGPGQAIRIIREVTKERLERQQEADVIVIEEMKKAGWYDKVFQVFPVLTNTMSTAVKGDGRFYGEVMAIRCYDSSDIMTTDWTKLPYELLQKMSSRIVNEVAGISRVVYDITTKPPATMEWE